MRVGVAYSRSARVVAVRFMFELKAVADAGEFRRLHSSLAGTSVRRCIENMVDGRIPSCGRTIPIRHTGCRQDNAAPLNVQGPRRAVTRISWRDFKNACRSQRSCHLPDTPRNRMENGLTCVQNARPIQIARRKSLYGIRTCEMLLILPTGNRELEMGY